MRLLVVGRGARIENCVLLDDTVVERDTTHSSEILFPGGALAAPGGSGA